MQDETNKLSPDSTDRIDAVCDAFEDAWSADVRPSLESFLEMVEETLRPALLRALLPVECELLRRTGEVPHKDDYHRRFPGQHDVVSEVFRLQRGLDASRLTLGNYELLEKIGAGGMGTVYKARHTSLDKLVAVKLLPHDFLKNERAVARFRREMQAVGKLDHPNIVRAMDAGQVDGTHYLVMEFVEGMDLAHYVKRHGPLPVEKAVEFIQQVARGLEYAHGRGLIHRDIKPANLLFCARGGDGSSLLTTNSTEALYGQIKVSDLGLARIEDESQKTEALTSTGVVMGTIDYMSPEQAEDMHRVDARSDIYSLGCTLFFLLTGRPPYKADNQVRRLLAHRDQPIPSLFAAIGTQSSDVGATDGTTVENAVTRPAIRGTENSVPGRPKLSHELAPLDGVFRKMIAKRPDDRFASMAAVVAALGQLRFSDASNSTASEPSSTAINISRPVQTRTGWLFLWTSVAVVLLAGAMLFVIVNQSGEPSNAVATDSGRATMTIAAETALPLAEEGSGPSLQASKITVEPPVDKEPSRLEEWLNGRTMLTVSQSDQGQFRTIQAALNVLRPGQVVEVLDSGPYEENLILTEAPKDSGLISRARTLIRAPRVQHPEVFSAHCIVACDGFRLSGFAFTDDPNSQQMTGHTLVIAGRGDVIVEDCFVQTSPPSDPNFVVQKLALALVARDENSRMTLRECRLAGRTVLHGEGKSLITRNFFSEYPSHTIILDILSPSAEIDVSRNVFRGTAIYWAAHSAAIARLSICDNTLLESWATLTVANHETAIPPTKVSFERNLESGYIQLYARDEKQSIGFWTRAGNLYIVSDLGKLEVKFVPPSSQDTVLKRDGRTLDESPNSPNYARMVNDPRNPQDRRQSVGALPIGPVPKDGDWFSRLRDRWNAQRLPTTATK